MDFIEKNEEISLLFIFEVREEKPSLRYTKNPALQLVGRATGPAVISLYSIDKFLLSPLQPSFRRLVNRRLLSWLRFFEMM